MRLLVLGTGLLVFLLLLFADKTNLTNDPEAIIQGGTASGAAVSGALGAKLPPLAPDEKLDKWISDASGKTGEEKISILDSIVVNLQARNRFAYAADYADQLVKLESSLGRKAVAGKLSQQATRLEYVSNDTALFRKYSNRAIEYLETVTAAEPENESAWLYLGLAYTESRKPQNAMKGILTIRKVLEINPNNVDASYNLGLFSMQTQQFDKAEQRFNQVLALEPDNEPAQYQLALVNVQLGKVDVARPMLENLIQNASNNEVRLTARQLMQSLP